MGLWDYGIMGLWDYGIMGLWDYGIMGLWDYGIMYQSLGHFFNKSTFGSLMDFGNNF